MLSYNKPPVEIEPKLFCIALHAQSGGNVAIFNAAVAAFTIETATAQAVQQLADSDPKLYADGQKLGGWHVKSHLQISPMKLDEMLERAYNEKDDHLLLQEKQELNNLMKTIVDTASRKLLGKYRSRFTTAEVQYMEDEIVKYENGN